MFSSDLDAWYWQAPKQQLCEDLLTIGQEIGRVFVAKHSAVLKILVENLGQKQCQSASNV